MTGTRRRLTLGALVDDGKVVIQTGPFGSQLHKHDYCSSGVPIVPTEAIGHRRLRTDGVPQIAPQKADELGRHRLKSGDILFARRGVQATGYSAIVEPQNEGWICGTGAILLRILDGDIDPNYLSFHLASHESISWLKQQAVGAVMPNLNEGILRRFPLELPPLKEQQRIADILGTLDDKIDLNRRINETLEGICRAIFNSWFVDFDPVHAKTALRRDHPKLSNAELSRRALPHLDPKIAELFPDRFEDCDLGLIPKDWTSGKLADVADNPRRTVKPSDVPPTTPYIGLQHMPRRCIALDDWGRADEVGSGKCQFKEGEILFGKLRPYFHKVGIAPVDGVCSTDILVVVPKSVEWHSYVLSLVSSKAFVDYTDSQSSGTKMPRTNWKDMGRYPVALPPVPLAKAFQEHVAALHQRVGIAVRQNRRLAGLRDTLLPKLLSGELEVPRFAAVREGAA